MKTSLTLPWVDLTDSALLELKRLATNSATSIQKLEEVSTNLGIPLNYGLFPRGNYVKELREKLLYLHDWILEDRRIHSERFTIDEELYLLDNTIETWAKILQSLSSRTIPVKEERIDLCFMFADDKYCRRCPVALSGHVSCANTPRSLFDKLINKLDIRYKRKPEDTEKLFVQLEQLCLAEVYFLIKLRCDWLSLYGEAFLLQQAICHDSV